VVDVVHLDELVVGNFRFGQEHVHVPRHSPGNRVNGESHIDAAFGQKIEQLFDAVLGLGNGHAVAGDDDDQVGLLHDLGGAFGRFAFNGFCFAARCRGLDLAERAEQDVGE
jgi:hypothetical protein